MSHKTGWQVDAKTHVQMKYHTQLRKKSSMSVLNLIELTVNFLLDDRAYLFQDIRGTVKMK